MCYHQEDMEEKLVSAWYVYAVDVEFVHFAGILLAPGPLVLKEASKPLRIRGPE